MVNIGHILAVHFSTGLLLQESISTFAGMLDRAHPFMQPDGSSSTPVARAWGSSSDRRLPSANSGDRISLALIEDTSILSRLDARLQSANQVSARASLLATTVGLQKLPASTWVPALYAMPEA